MNELSRSNSELIPNEMVCGATTDSWRHWNWTNKHFGEQTDPLKSLEVAMKYFGTATETEVLCSRQIFKLCIDQSSNCGLCPLKFNCASFQPTIMSEIDLTFADFFCGAGGLSLGFECEGFVPKIANDIDPWFLLTYRFNRPKQPLESRAEGIHDWILRNKTLSNWKIDVVSGGVPCQSFSNANRQRRVGDLRDNLYSNLIEAATIIDPKILLIENVGGILKKYDVIINDLRNHGYFAEHIILDAKDYGIPQNRKRVFFIGLNVNKIKNPERQIRVVIDNLLLKKNPKRLTLSDAISDLPILSAHNKKNDTAFNNSSSGFSLMKHDLGKSSNYVKEINQCRGRITPLYNHKARFNNSRDLQIFEVLKAGENSLASSIQHLNPYKSRNHIFKDKYYKLEYNKECKTITAHMRYDCNMYIHPTQIRGLSAREAARVQSFPDDYVFLGNFQRIYQQIGNAVPPLLAAVIANSLKKILIEER